MDKVCKVTYVSNAGIMLECNDNKILIDGFSQAVIPIYKSPSDKIKQLMILGLNPFESIEALLFTHEHVDHFSADDTINFIEHNEDAYILGSQRVIMELTQKNPTKHMKNIIKLDTTLGNVQEVNVNGVKIQSFSMIHDGEEYENVRNLGYLIEIGGRKILHVGDAKPVKENYQKFDLINKGLDLLIAPFPYVGLPTARRVIEEYIRPKKIVAVHLPYPNLDKFGWIDATMKSFNKIKEKFFETVFFENIGEFINI